jgi:hypothetical protein
VITSPLTYTGERETSIDISGVHTSLTIDARMATMTCGSQVD